MNSEDKLKEYSAAVCIVGLGYVGLPLAEAFSRHIRVIGYDVDKAKVAELNMGEGGIEFTTDASQIKEADFVIIAVPTPVTKAKDPDLSYVMSAARTIGQNLKKGAVVVLESTVYPGATEEVVKPILEEESGMRCGTDFRIGYSPERINPGDEEHTTESITKIIAGMDADSADRLAWLYGLITSVYRAKDIKTAEAAKVIENVQRNFLRKNLVKPFRHSASLQSDYRARERTDPYFPQDGARHQSRPRGCRDEVELSPVSRHGYANCTHLQYVQSADACRRWQGGSELCGSGTPGRGSHRVRGWIADAIVLLCV